MNYNFIHEEACKVLKQCEEVKQELNSKRTLDIVGTLHYSSPDMGYSNGGRFGFSDFSGLVDDEASYSSTNTEDTVISSQDIEWRKLVNGMNVFLQIVDRPDYEAQFQTIVDNAIGGVTDKVVEDTEVLVNQIDGALKVESMKKPNGAGVEDVAAADKEKRHKILFISHSTSDKPYMEAFIRFLESLGLNGDKIVCTSIDGYGIPLGENIYKWLIEKFQTCDLHVIFVLSHNYYNSASSLNEMGAAWATRQKWDALLLPGFGFSEVRGCIDKDQMLLKLDDENAKHKLGELRDELIKEFSLKNPNEARWEKYRDEFLKSVQTIYGEEKIETERLEMENDAKN